ncbi:MAG: DEAD/DEAH box helicase family protein [Bacteriovorax sp.]|nr:DEAD/DEAH box helicase family protein [Bacteriovorax sp.]
MSNLVPGQRFMSETEPELGLGILQAVENKTVKISFLAAKTERTYGSKGAPIKRVVFAVGDEVTLRSGEKITVEAIIDEEGIVDYKSSTGIFNERELSDSLSFNKPEDRLFAGTVDAPSLFELRYKTLLHRNRMTQSKVRGFIGGRMDLIPHQFYVANQISDRLIPRVLLADEVGLGKTIEAGLALHHLILSERVKRALILVPDSLVYQWFIEMLRKFNLSFVTMNQETHLEPGTNPFTENDFVIVNIGLFKGADMARKLIMEATWDIMIVDEAHQLKWSQESVSAEYKIVEMIAKKSKGLLLLTATPEQLGMEGHFARLKLLDPDRFYDYPKFLEETNHYEEVAKEARALIKKGGLESETKLKELQDLHGPGRIFFRNTRNRMSKHFSFFPKRILHSYPLESKKTQYLSLEDEETIGPSFDMKLDWLTQFLSRHIGEKILLITKSKTKVLCLEQLLKDRHPGMNIGVFHSGLSFVARDRQAAYFADPEGADILLCTEIGSEGRNFEFAHHLVLFDLPMYPDLLEQRIGRLDRIGQESDIHLHVPYIVSSYDEVLFQWYNTGLDAFVHSAKGASIVHQQLQTLLEQFLNNPSICFKDPVILQDFLETTKKEFKDVSHKLEEGRDILVELNSFKEEIASEIIDEVKKFDNEANLVHYMNEVFQELGVDIEDLDDGVYFIRPSDNMYVPYFPGLPVDGIRITYERKTALRREDVEFLTWDHPMVVGVIDLILSNTYGNMSVMIRKKSGATKTFIETFYKLQVVAPKNLSPERFFPPTPIRILVDSAGDNFSAKFEKDDIDEKINGADADTIRKAKSLSKSAVQKVLQTAHQYALIEAAHLKARYKKNMIDHLDAEKMRLLKLKAVNPVVRSEEIDALTSQIEILSKCYDEAEVVLDSLRVIF